MFSPRKRTASRLRAIDNVDNGIYGYVNGAVANSETAKEDNTFTDLYEEGYDFYETPAAADAE